MSPSYYKYECTNCVYTIAECTKGDNIYIAAAI